MGFRWQLGNWDNVVIVRISLEFENVDTPPSIIGLMVLIGSVGVVGVCSVGRHDPPSPCRPGDDGSDTEVHVAEAKPHTKPYTITMIIDTSDTTPGGGAGTTLDSML